MEILYLAAVTFVMQALVSYQISGIYMLQTDVQKWMKSYDTEQIDCSQLSFVSKSVCIYQRGLFLSYSI